MANETITMGECYVCNGKVEFKADKNGKAYYACGHCSTRLFMGAAASNALKETLISNEKEEKEHVQVQTEQRPTETREPATTGTVAAVRKQRSGFGGIFDL